MGATLVIKKDKNDSLWIGELNRRSLIEVVRLDILKREIYRLKLHVVGISQVWWHDENDFMSGNHRVINTGETNEKQEWSL